MEQIVELIADFFSSIFGYSETLFNIIELIADVFLDILKTLPILFLVYLLLEVLNKRFENKNIKTATLKKYGPLAGAIVGTIPQCGFSSAAAALYKNRAIGAATLISVFISTSDEALPIMLSYPEKMPMVLLLIGTKLIIALIAGYVLSFTIFKNEKIVISSKNEEKSCENDDCKSCHHHKNIFITALIHSLKICLYIFVTLLVIQLGFYFIGEENLSKFLLSNNIFQPVLAAIFGLIPGCGTSVLVT
ncbi:MAG: putative manganese transporter, partial [Oscillospiraceae bacterium]